MEEHHRVPMSVLNHLLFLDPDKHPYVVMSGKGTPRARFSNLPCAAQSVTGKHQKRAGTVITPEGDVLDKEKCQIILQSKKIVEGFMSRKGVENGSR